VGVGDSPVSSSTTAPQQIRSRNRACSGRWSSARSRRAPSRSRASRRNRTARQRVISRRGRRSDTSAWGTGRADRTVSVLAGRPPRCSKARSAETRVVDGGRAESPTLLPGGRRIATRSIARASPRLGRTDLLAAAASRSGRPGEGLIEGAGFCSQRLADYDSGASWRARVVHPFDRGRQRSTNAGVWAVLGRRSPCLRVGPGSLAKLAGRVGSAWSVGVPPSSADRGAPMSAGSCSRLIM